MRARWLAISVLTFSDASFAQRAWLVSQAPTGGTAVGGAGAASVSHAGAHVAFQSTASVWVSGDTNGASDVFVRNMPASTFERVSLSSSGAEGDGASSEPHISSDGRFVAFTSAARNLQPALDSADWTDVFLRDRALGLTTKLSVTPSGGESTNRSFQPRVADDGERVAFVSEAGDLVAGDTTGYWDVFVWERATGRPTRVSVRPDGASPLGNSYHADLSRDGRFVAFASEAADLVPGDTNGVDDVFVRDLMSGVTVRVSVSHSGAQADRSSASPSISADGRFVAFTSLATNLVFGDVNNWQDVFVRDVQLGTTVLASRSASGVQANYSSFAPSISADGRYVAFHCYSSLLFSPPPVLPPTLVRKNLVTGEVLAVGITPCGLRFQTGALPRLSPDGDAVVFATKDPHGANGDLNDIWDVFLYDLTAQPVATPCTFCAVLPTSSGCLPEISASGTPSATASSGYVLSVTGVDPGRTGQFVLGLYPDTVPFSGGNFLCIGTVHQRFGFQSATGAPGVCNGVLSADWNTLTSGYLAGTAVFVQAWFRDPPAAGSARLSQALGFLVAP